MKISFIELLKESVDYYRDRRPHDRGGNRPQFKLVLQRELLNLVPPSFLELGTDPVESIFVAVVFIEPNICSDLIPGFSKFWTDSFENSLSLQIRLERSLQTGNLSKVLHRSDSDRFQIRTELLENMRTALVPELQKHGVHLYE